MELAYKFCKLAASQGIAEARAFILKIKATLEPRACAACAAVEPALGTYQKCAACRSVRYCGAECQRAHWKAVHTGECKEMADKAETEKRGVFASMSRGR